jgi:CheY-like chemotaxis protein
MKTILIVDDEFGIVDALSDLLRDEGFGVVTAPNGKLGLQAIEKLVPDLVLLDVMMPVMNGFETLRHIRATPTSRHVPVILMSAAPRSVALAKGGEMSDFAEYLRKPFDLERLFETIVRAIGPDH